MKYSILNPVFAAALAFALAPVVQASDSGPLARIGEQDIAADELQSLLSTLDAAQREAIRNEPAALGQIVRNYLVQKVVLTKAIEDGWDARPEVKAAIEAARNNAIVESYLQAKAKAPADYPSDDDLRTVYEENKSALRQPRQFNLSQIYIAAPEDAGTDVLQAAEAKAATVVDRLAKDDADFGVLARLHSDEAASAERGGELGWLPETQIRPEIRAAVAGLEPGQMSDPVRLADGFYIVKCHEFRQARTPEFDEVKDLLARQMRLETEQANRQNTIFELLAEKPVAINEIAVTGLLRSVD